MYIATDDYWRPGHSWSVPEADGMAFLEDSYDLETGRRGSPSFPKLVQSGPKRQILSNRVDTNDRLDRKHQIIYTGHTFYIIILFDFFCGSLATSGT